MHEVSQNVFLIDHPVVRHKVTMLRDKGAQPWLVRMLTKEVATMIAYEAVKDLSVSKINIETPDSKMWGDVIKQKVGVLPIMRAGEGMLNGVLELLTDVEVWHIGVEGGHGDHHSYYNKLANRVTPPTFDYGIILDPVLKTGCSAKTAIKTLQELGIPKMKFLGIVGTEEGITTIRSEMPEIEIYLTSIENVDDRNWIPGWGDAGDRQFNTKSGE